MYMPWGDCTGPWWAQGRDYGYGRGRGQQAWGFGPRANRVPNFAGPWWISESNEREFLNNRIKFLEEELEYLRNRMKSLNKDE